MDFRYCRNTFSVSGNNQMNSEQPVNKDLLVFETKTPLNYYLTIGLTISSLLLFSHFTVLGRLDYGSAIFYIIFFYVIIYAYFGRYLAKVKLYSNRIEVKYLIPWNMDTYFSFNKLFEVKSSDRPLLFYSDRWYRAYQSIFVINDKGEAWQCHYNINEESHQILVSYLDKQKIKAANIAFVKT